MLGQREKINLNLTKVKIVLTIKNNELDPNSVVKRKTAKGITLYMFTQDCVRLSIALVSCPYNNIDNTYCLEVRH